MFFFNATKIRRSKLKHKGLRWRSTCMVRVRPISPGPTMKPRLSARRNPGGNLFNIAESITGIYLIGKTPADFHSHQHTLHCHYHEAEVQLSQLDQGFPWQETHCSYKTNKNLMQRNAADVKRGSALFILYSH